MKKDEKPIEPVSDEVKTPEAVEAPNQPAAKTIDPKEEARRRSKADLDRKRRNPRKNF
jgi:hypothetical protein